MIGNHASETWSCHWSCAVLDTNLGEVLQKYPFKGELMTFAINSSRANYGRSSYSSWTKQRLNPIFICPSQERFPTERRALSWWAFYLDWTEVCAWKVGAQKDRNRFKLGDNSNFKTFAEDVKDAELPRRCPIKARWSTLHCFTMAAYWRMFTPVPNKTLWWTR